MYWSENESVHDPEICNNASSNYLNSSYISPDNPSIPQSKYPILEEFVNRGQLCFNR